MRIRKNIARRCCLSQLVVLTTIIFAIARVINTPAHLDFSTVDRIDGKNYEMDSASNFIVSPNVIFSREESSESEPNLDIKSDNSSNIPPVNNTTDNNSSEVNNTVETDPSASPTNTTSNITNTTELNTNNNVTEDNTTETTIPEECIGLETVYSENDLLEHSHWWISMTSFGGKTK